MLLQKKVTKAGSVTIPTLIREQLNIPKGAAVELETKNEELIIRKHIPTCVCCGTADHVVTYAGLEICQDCLKKAKEASDNNGDS